MNGRGCVPIKLCLQTKFCKYIKINHLSTPAPSIPHLAARASQTQTGPCHSSPEVVHQPRLDQFKLAVWFTVLQSKRGPWEQHHHHLEACLRNAESQAAPRPADQKLYSSKTRRASDPHTPAWKSCGFKTPGVLVPSYLPLPPHPWPLKPPPSLCSQTEKLLSPLCSMHSLPAQLTRRIPTYLWISAQASHPPSSPPCSSSTA